MLKENIVLAKNIPPLEKNKGISIYLVGVCSLTLGRSILKVLIMYDIQNSLFISTMIEIFIIKTDGGHVESMYTCYSSYYEENIFDFYAFT